MANDTKITEELKQEVVKLVAELLQQAFAEFSQQSKPAHIEDAFRAQEQRQQEFQQPTPQELVTQRAQEKAEERRQRQRDRGEPPHIDRFKEGTEERQHQPPATPPRREPKAAEPPVQPEPGLQPRNQAPVAPVLLPEIESVDAFSVVSYPQREKDQRTGNFETDTGKLQGSAERTTDALHDLFETVTTFLDRLGDNIRTAKRNVEQLDSEQAREVKA